MSLVKLVIVLFSILLITQLIFGSHLKHEHVKRNPGSSTNDTEIQGRQGSSLISLKEGEEKNKRKASPPLKERLLEVLNLTKYSERRTNNNAAVSFPWTTDKENADDEFSELDPRRRRGSTKNVPQNAFSNDINACLFSGWRTASIITNAIQCNVGTGLCYATDPNAGTASFAVCYNTQTLTPDFTGHIVQPHGGSGRGASGFESDVGQFGPNPQSTSDDYLTKNQGGLYNNFKPPPSRRYLARGHLVPNADFGSDAERALTFIMTNVAPQWQLFNMGNWYALERAIRTYVNRKNRNVYVFTGVGGATNILLNNQVQTPKYFWKAVCDPTEKESVFFYAENPVGIVDRKRRRGCNGAEQTKSKGVIECTSIRMAKRKFVVPNFNANNCYPSVKGLSGLTLILTGFVR
ncbi:unnamed protein product [Porites lobata]|uniref:DNA/RNA non-specific endonuclease domain-containing protein n=1 Tax=Porites lobata TaxID=104759 RepID=A0ABN8NAI1_9CNID|nr:unnamed protein product [Porites lobata]